MIFNVHIVHIGWEEQPVLQWAYSPDSMKVYNVKCTTRKKRVKITTLQVIGRPVG